MLKKIAALGLLSAIVVAAVLLFFANRRVGKAFDSPVAAERPVEFSIVEQRPALPYWGSEDVESVVVLPGGTYLAGAFGIARLDAASTSAEGSLQRVDISSTLPTRRASALTAWRSDLVAALEAGGLFLYREGSWSEVRSGFGALHVRDLAESASGELWIGAREGLFRMGLGERTIARLHSSPVRSIAIASGGRILSGGEKGLFVTEGPVTTTVALEGLDAPWIDRVLVFAQRIHAVTPLGLFAEGDDGRLRSVPNGANAGDATAFGDTLVLTSNPPDAALRRLDSASRLQVEQLSSPARRVFVVDGRLLSDTEKGLVEKTEQGWRNVGRARERQALGQAHVGAIVEFRGRLIVGFFDGGIAELAPRKDGVPSNSLSPADDAAQWKLSAIEGAQKSPVWAVNALLNAGGVLHIASLRGAFRFDGAKFSAVEGSGAAFSLAQTRNGIAIGFGEGVLLPELKLLSAFHGLPGNQATALAALDGGLLVGTPSGVGYIEGRSVRWRVASGDGKLPHPWVTAILPTAEGVLVGTYGGGLTRRVGALTSPGEWRPFAETQGLKINTGCLIEVGGRVFAGSDGLGLFRLTKDGTRFEPLKLALPSPRVTALFAKDGFFYIGTDEGLTRWPVEGQ